ncbi:MAG: AraC family transcriptional regulator, partial [Gemmatimonadetes bacterium]|nr:AraC family transcriptional regulator [Gemmatimonadota bacterium]
FRPHRQFRNHFSRAFKEASGMSPSYYRKQLQEEQAVVSP